MKLEHSLFRFSLAGLCPTVEVGWRRCVFGNAGFKPHAVAYLYVHVVHSFHVTFFNTVTELEVVQEPHSKHNQCTPRRESGTVMQAMTPREKPKLSAILTQME